MKDGIIKADGTSRLLRATLPESYEEFRAMAGAGTLPLDVLFNAAGWRQSPTFLNKAALLKDTTAAMYGLTDAAVPDDVLSLLSKTFVLKQIPAYSKISHTAGEIEKGSSVYISENGVFNEYIVVYQGLPDSTVYDASCNGTWLMRKDLLGKMTSSTSSFAGSNVETYLNSGAYYQSLPDWVKSGMKTVKIPYQTLSGSTVITHQGADGHETKVFIPAYDELGSSATSSRDGYSWGIFTSNAQKVAKFDGAATGYATRTCYYSDDTACRYFITPSGSYERYVYSYSDYSYTRPVMILDPNTEIVWYEDSAGNKHESQSMVYEPCYPSGEPANMGSIPVFATGSYIGTGTYGSGSPNRLAFPFAPKLLVLEYCVTLIPADEETTQYYSSGSYKPNIKIKREGTTVSWYNSANDPVLGSGTSGNASSQLNAAGKTYHYIAFG